VIFLRPMVGNGNVGRVSSVMAGMAALMRVQERCQQPNPTLPQVLKLHPPALFSRLVHKFGQRVWFYSWSEPCATSELTRNAIEHQLGNPVGLWLHGLDEAACVSPGLTCFSFDCRACRWQCSRRRIRMVVYGSLLAGYACNPRGTRHPDIRCHATLCSSSAWG
jgi:hypothetical protein